MRCSRWQALFVLFLLLLLSGCGSLGFFSGVSLTVERETLVIRMREGKIYRLRAPRPGLLHVVVEQSGAVFRPARETLMLPAGGEPPQRTEAGYTLGGYRVKARQGGFSLHHGERELFRTGTFNDFHGAGEAFLCGEGETLHGLGHASRSVFLSHATYPLRNVSRYGNQAFLFIPYIFSSGGDAFYFNAGSRDSFVFTGWKTGRIGYIPAGPAYDFYYYHEPAPHKQVQRLYGLAGQPRLLPRWAFGYLQSKYGYRNEAEVQALVREFEKRAIPVSAVILDHYWFDQMGDLDWQRTNWPDPRALHGFLEKRGIKLVTITEPFFASRSRNYGSFDSLDMFAKDKSGDTVTWNKWWTLGKSPWGAVINPFSETTKRVLGEKYVAMLRDGVDGFWTDLGEPEEVPERALFSGMTEAEAHNYFNRAWSALIHDAVRKAFPRLRLFNLTRSGFTGSWQYGTSTWSGDVASTFAALRFHPGLGLSAGLSGLPFWGSDMGGFESRGRPPERELFIRWMQFGAFTPVFRAHGANSPREPWTHDEAATAIISRYIRMRYQLLPYIYATAFQTRVEGLPIMRPLFFTHPGDPHSWSLDDQYWFGDALLVAPVLQRMAEASGRTVHLPPGEWYDFHTWQRVPAGTRPVAVRLDDIPLYLRGGSLVPLQEGNGFVLLAVPGSGTSRWTWYDDDGVSNDYEQGGYSALVMTLSLAGLQLEGIPPQLKTLILRIPATCGVRPEGALLREEAGRRWYEKRLSFTGASFTIGFVRL